MGGKIKMYEIQVEHASEEFAECWISACRHLAGISGFGEKQFIRLSLTPILLDHLSFIMGNQLFFVHVNDSAARVEAPSTIEACIHAAELGNGVPCKLTMKRSSDGLWEPVDSDWGLRHAISDRVVRPQEFFTNEDIEISDWEVLDIANRRIIGEIERSNGTVLSFNSDPNVNPSIYFIDEHEAPHFVIVSVARYPFEPRLDQSKIDEVKSGVAGFSTSGFHAQVTIVAQGDPFDPHAVNNGNYLPLIRGRGYHQKYSGLLPI